MDHKEKEQTDSIKSMESGYGSVKTANNTTKCDICSKNCSEPIVVWFSKHNSTTKKTTLGSKKDREESAVMAVGFVCNSCFGDGSLEISEKLKQQSRIKSYRPTSINMSPEPIEEEMTATKSRKSSVWERMACSVIALLSLLIVVILFILLVILMSTGTLPRPSPSGTNSDGVHSAALVQNVDDLKVEYLTLLEQIEKLKNQSIKRQNDVDTILANHTMALLEISHSINKTDSNKQLTPGAGSRCSHYIPRQHTSAAVSETRTPWYPTDSDPQMVITGVDCSVTGGISSQLETRQQDDLKQYSCVCPAQTNTDSIIHTCTIHIWSCSL